MNGDIFNLPNFVVGDMVRYQNKQWEIEEIDEGVAWLVDEDGETREADLVNLEKI